MNVIPQAPFDNLYKFIAISGLWLLSISFIYFYNIDDLSYKSSQEFHKKHSYQESKRNLEKIKLRIKSIDEAKYSENVISYITPQDGSKDELSMLSSFKKFNEGNIEEYEKSPYNKKYLEDLNFETSEYRVNKISIIYWFGAIFTILGFFCWWLIIQRRIDNINKLDLEYKKLVITKIKSEIRYMGKSAKLRNR